MIQFGNGRTWVQVLALLGLAAVIVYSKEFDAESGYLYVDEDTPGNTIEDLSPGDLEIHPRWKRDTTDSGWSLKGLPGAGYLRKLESLMKTADDLPKPIKDAIKHGDFSNVTVEQLQEVNVSVLEYVPPQMFQKMNGSIIEAIVKMFLDSNKPNALSRLIEMVGDKISPMQLINRIKQPSSSSPLNEASSALLYSIVSRLGDSKEGLTDRNIEKLHQHNLLDYVPEEQLMKVKESKAAKSILEKLYSGTPSPERNEQDDKSLISRLVETQYGAAKNWTQQNLKDAKQYLKFMPSAFLKHLKPETISSSINDLRSTDYESPLQAKAVTDAYLETVGITKNADGAPQGNTANIENIIHQLGKLAAFVNPATTSNQRVTDSIIRECDKLNLPAPLLAIKSVLQREFKGKSVSALTRNDLNNINSDVLRSSPPEVIKRAMDTQHLQEAELKEISQEGPMADQGFFQSPFFKGLMSQLAAYAVKFFKERANLMEMPGTFIGGLGVKGIETMNRDELQVQLTNLRKNPDCLDEGQKAILLQRLIQNGMLDIETVPPEFLSLKPRDRTKRVEGSDTDGLPADSELRLAYGEGDGKVITGQVLERDPRLIGTLTPKQVNLIKLDDVPAVLAQVRKSKDGPQPQTLKALRDQFVAYLRLKANDYEDQNDKKLLKHVSAAEVSKLPASVLAYFIDPRQTAKLPANVRKEILIAMGEMSTKDRALIPGKTREEIISQGLDALDSILDGKSYDVPELAAIGNSVGDLPEKGIERLTPVAVEQALDMIQGTTGEEGGLKQRACLNANQKKAWRNKILENYGKPKTWDPAMVTSLCCVLPLLTEDDLRGIAKESLVTCNCVSDNAPPSHLSELKRSLDRACEHELGKPDDTKKSYEKVKAERAMDLSDLESQILTGTRRRKRAHDHGHKSHSLSCFAVRLAGNGAAFETGMLETINATDMKSCLYELGSVKLEPASAKILWEKLGHAAPGHQVKNIEPADLQMAGYILSGIQLHEVESLDFSNPDVTVAFGRPLGFSKTLLERMAKHLNKQKTITMQSYTPVDLIVARNILCGFEIQSLSRIVAETFAKALPVLRNLDPGCEMTRLNTLANIATHQKVFGKLENWTAADVRGVGILLIGLSSDASKIPAESFLGVSPTVAAALSETTLKSLSADQLGNIPRFSAQAMTEAQLSALTNDGRESLQSIIRGPLVTDTSVNLQTFPLSTFITLLITTIFAHRVL